MNQRTWIGPNVYETFRSPVAPGRNDPCPCGSGKKVKKCGCRDVEASVNIDRAALLRAETRHPGHLERLADALEQEVRP
jgi:hypothetical protein